MKAIIIAGGSGTRLWPLSREKYPKQFLKLKYFEHSLFQMTFKRCLQFCTSSDIYIVTNNEYKYLIKTQLAELGAQCASAHLLFEPQMKNTLPAIFYGVQEIQKNGDDIVAVIPSDHLIVDNAGFAKSIDTASALATEYMFTFGVKPTRPETGYGYIKQGEALAVGERVDQFKEKPDAPTAELYMQKGYLWNSGIFLFDTALFAGEVKKHSPEVYAAFQAQSVEERFERTPRISIDYGVMEKSDKVAVLPLGVRWDDLGSFFTFFEAYSDKIDENGNGLFGENVAIDCKGSLLYSDDDKKLTAMIGLEDLIVVDQSDALLISRKDRTQDVKKIVDMLGMKKDRRKELHLTEYRPWGSFTILEESENFKIKRLSVLPGQKLSYQLHHRRSEHWVVVSGTATVTLDGVEKIIHTNENVFIDKESKHRVFNAGSVILEIIEVQSGEYLGEDDIERFSDDFGRK